MRRPPIFRSIWPGNMYALLPVAVLATVFVIPAATPAAEAEHPADFHTRWAEQAFVNGPAPFSFVYDGRRSSELLGKWRRAVSEETAGPARQRRSLTFTDPQTGLEVRALATVYADTPSVEWTLYFTNRGHKDTPVLEQVHALDVAMKADVPGDVRLHRLRGSDCRVDDWLPLEDTLPPGGRIDFAPAGGRPSSGACPFFNLQWGNGGVITAVGWSGQWAAMVERSKQGVIRLTAGMQTMHLKLSPGETIRSPRILQLYWFGKDPFLGYNLFRRVMLAHIVPRSDGRPVVPPIAHMGTSLYELNDTNEANVLAHLRSIEGLGFELFWMDAYWTKGGFPNGMGNYGFPLKRVEPADRFPNGLKAISDAVHNAGLGYIMWFEPERVADGTYLAKEHPDWVITLPGRSVRANLGQPDAREYGLLNLGIPEAREYLTKYLIAAIRRYRLNWLRIDYNLDPLAFWQSLDKLDPDHVGRAEIRYVEGLYRMWDDIRAAGPQVPIDNCASGGRRIDLETESRSIPLWRSDSTCQMGDRGVATWSLFAIENQVESAGLNRYVPLNGGGQIGAGPYFFRSGFNGGIPFGEDVRPKDYRRDLLKRAIAEAKRIRKYYSGDFYVLCDVTTSPRDWCVLQYHRPAKQDGMVLAFRRHESPYSALTAELRGIDPAIEYDVTKSVTYETGQPVRLNGAQLQTLKIDLDQRPASMIIEYRAVRNK